MKYAILIGINKYDGCPLKGCVNDVLFREEILRLRYGFTEIITLTDEQATKENIKATLDKFASVAKKGDIIYLLFSGHGTQVPDLDNDEDDGLAEVICLYGFDWTANTYFSDDDLADFARKLPEGVYLLGTFDSCHSGGGVRDIARRSKFLPNPGLIMNLCNKISKPFLNSLQMTNAVIISGCEEKQTCADAHIDGVACGAFSHYTDEALKESGYDITYEGIVTRSYKLLQDNGYEQRPELWCDYKWLGTKFLN